MHSVRCVDVDEDSGYSDCRAVERIGVRRRTGELEYLTPEEAYLEVEDDVRFIHFHMARKSYLQAVEQDGVRYVRTEPMDTERDGL